jgi:hypothetical protein
MGAKVVGAAMDGSATRRARTPAQPRRRKRTGEGGTGDLVRRQARRLLPLLLGMMAKASFPAAFCAATIAWGAALALCLGVFGVVGW